MWKSYWRLLHGVPAASGQLSRNGVRRTFTAFSRAELSRQRVNVRCTHARENHRSRVSYSSPG